MNCTPGACEFPELIHIGGQLALLPCTACGASPLYSIQTLRTSRDIWLHKFTRLTDQMVDLGLQRGRFESALRDLMELLAICTDPKGEGMVRLTCQHEEITEMLIARLNVASALLGMPPAKINTRGNDDG